MADDLHSAPLTVGGLALIIGFTSVVCGGASAVVHSMWPPQLCDADKQELSAARDATKALDAVRESATNATRATMSASQDVRCALVELRAHFDASDDLGSRASTQERKAHRYSVAKKRLRAATGCPEPVFEDAN
jgi:hypothetical protein